MTGRVQTTLERVRPLRRGGVAVARGARGLLRLCLLLILLCVILVAVLTGSARIGLPFLAAYKPSLETRLSDYLQSPVSIEELDARWAGTGPILRARGVQLTDPEGRHAQFDELLIDVNVPRSVFAAAPIMDELTLVGADLALDYDTEKGLRIHGVNRDGAYASNSRDQDQPRGDGFNAVAWLLTAARVGMLDTRLTVQMPDDTSITLDDINVRAENRGNLHQIRMDVSLPSELGKAFELGADLLGDGNNLTKASGNFYIKADDFQAAGIERLLQSYELTVPMLDALSQRGTNAQLELWGELREGAVRRLNGRTALAQAAGDNPTVDSLFGDLSWTREDSGGWEFAAKDVVVGRRGAEAVFDEIRMGTEIDGQPKPQWLSLSTAETELLPVINTVTTLMPSALPPAANRWLRSARPSAKIRRADFSLSLLDPAGSFDLSAQFDDMQWASAQKLPGARLASMNVDIVDGRGSIELPEQAISIDPPAILSPSASTDVPTLLLKQLAWAGNIDLPNQTLSGTTSVVQDQAQLEFVHTTSLNEKGRPHLDLQGKFKAGSILDLKPWLNQGWMPPGTRRWLEAALQGGEVKNGRLLFFGSLDDWPFIEREGVMRAEFDVTDASLKFLSTWPAATSVDAQVVFDRTRLTSIVTAGELDGLPIGKATAVIENLFDPSLQMTMTSETALSTLVEFGNTGPLQNILKPILGGAEVSGPARLEVAVDTPLRRPVAMSN